jgi:hypothetical protein
VPCGQWNAWNEPQKLRFCLEHAAVHCCTSLSNVRLTSQTVSFTLQGLPVPQEQVMHVCGAAEADLANSAEPAMPAPMIFSACRREVARAMPLDT